MVTSTSRIQIGCTVTLPASRFDDDDEDRWSVAQFGDEADTKQLECLVITRRGKRWKVRVLFDDDLWYLEPECLTHDPASCPRCSSGSGQTLPNPDAEAAAPAHESPARSPQRSGAGPDPSDPFDVPSGLDTDSDDDNPLADLAAAAAAATPSEAAAGHGGSEGQNESSGGAPAVADAPVRRPRAAAARAMQVVAEAILSDSSEYDSEFDSSLHSGDSDDYEDQDDDSSPAAAGEGAARGRGRGRGRGGRGRGRGRGRSTADQQHGETETTVTRHNVTWTKGKQRTIDPMESGGYCAPPRLMMHNYTEKNELDYFLRVFTKEMFEAIAGATSREGKNKIRPTWNLHVGELLLFIGLKIYIMINSQSGPVEQYWDSLPRSEGKVQVIHDLGRYGMSCNRYREIERAFTLPSDNTVPLSDVFRPVRWLVTEWNNNMFHAFKPGSILTVDESMGRWLGKGMPGLMIVPRKPTPVGREAHTTACAISGVIIFYEPYEGKQLMKDKDFCRTAGKNPAKALRCTRNWFGSGRLVVLDSGFASVKCALHLHDHGLFMIGNVKTGTTGFPKDWLLSQVPSRGDRAVASATVTSPAGNQVDLLAAADRDRQPMALLGTAGTSLEGRTLTRHFTTIRADGTYNVREATLQQMQIHEVYREYFNALDRHNSLRQGGDSFEDSWKTHHWYIREFQVLFGMSEVNAWLLYKRFRPGCGNVSFNDYRRSLCYLLLHNNLWLEETRQTRAAAAAAAANTGNLHPSDPHPFGRIGTYSSGAPMQRACVFCGKKTSFVCRCEDTSGEVQETPLCALTQTGRDCFSRHRAGEQQPNARSEAQQKRRRVEAASRSSNLGGGSSRGRGRHRSGQGGGRGQC